MIRVVSKKTFDFVDAEIITKKVQQRFLDVDGKVAVYESEGEKEAKVRNVFRVNRSSLPQICPDWIANDELFTIAQSDGNLTVLK
jgi:hypothetical protein